MKCQICDSGRSHRQKWDLIEENQRNLFVYFFFLCWEVRKRHFSAILIRKYSVNCKFYFVFIIAVNLHFILFVENCRIFVSSFRHNAPKKSVFNCIDECCHRCLVQCAKFCDHIALRSVLQWNSIFSDVTFWSNFSFSKI